VKVPCALQIFCWWVVVLPHQTWPTFGLAVSSYKTIRLMASPNSLVSLCAIPYITTLPCISAYGMLSVQPSSALRQLPPSCSYHLERDPWSLTLTLISWQPIHTCVINLVHIPANEVTYAIPQSLTSQKAPLPQASWNLHTIAVWNTVAWLHLNGHNLTWLQDLAQDNPEAHWHLNSTAYDHIRNFRHAETATGLKTF